MTVNNLSGPGRGPVCQTCNGKGKKRGMCLHCSGAGVINPSKPSYYACPYCSNHRCLSCGGDGVPPIPRPSTDIVGAIVDT